MMNKTDDASIENKNGRLIKEIKTAWDENITAIDLSRQNIKILDKYINFPHNVTNLNLSWNYLTQVPDAVINLPNLKILDISHNEITYFDDVPAFCNNLENLNLSNNKLQGPPYWVWSEEPAKLNEINLSSNWDITYSFKDSHYFKEFLEYKPKIDTVIIYNCKLYKHITILSTLSNVKVLFVGGNELMYAANHVETIPCSGLQECVQVQTLNLCNTGLSTVLPSITLYKDLVEIDLSQNYIHSLPEELGQLAKLKVCILSHNNILYIPDSIVQLKNLVCLMVDNNELCIISEDVCTLPNLGVLDLYNNNLYEVPDAIYNIEELDLAQNYFDELEDKYKIKKEKLRMNKPDRFDGRKVETTYPESDHSPCESEDEDYDTNISSYNPDDLQVTERSSTPEDWDSDDFWIPYDIPYTHATTPNWVWLHFVKRKMDEGNFCPVDAHTVPIAEQVQYEKLCNPQVNYESDGQFDDYLEDDS